MDPLQIGPPCQLGENPLYRPRENAFYWTDIPAGKVYRWRLGEAAGSLVLQANTPTGAFVFARDGSLLLFGRQGALRCVQQNSRWRMEDAPVWPVSLAEDERFNDAICDAAGRVLAGTKTDRDEAGTLYLFEKGASPRALLTGLKISNGMGFSPDGTRFYHTDSGESCICTYDYNVQTGFLSNPRPFYTLAGAGTPDGMTVDTAGNVWTACWSRGMVLQISPEGEEVQRIKVPAVQCSSLTFGGPGYTDLFVTSAAVGLAAKKDQHNADGLCYYYKNAGKGRPEFEALYTPPRQIS